ncbi:ROK family transcriptional regulator [Allobranchiibius sp. GilTou73]|uniref:ROK family transcriptional regulator n=1 Tax=Allobranchiibius sp. GilTou73 TaxID=2904523 RepID=UPI001F31C8B4|nr:ROK family transcriptional regulator [Allobranchiibius sp. GilTou73]UIJ35339.1 ROK family transcriptional regulator [Allobranchiibius sp. GilTou73]
MARQISSGHQSIRSHNLRIVLSEIHRRGRLSRAELTRVTGFNRSTIKVLVAQLEELGLVSEYAPAARGTAGRPSPIVGPRTDGPYAVAVDVAVSHLTVAAVALGGRVLARHSIDLADVIAPEEIVAEVVAGVGALADSIPGQSWLIGVGVSVPGTVRRRDSRILAAPNLHWDDVDLVGMLQVAFGDDIPIHLGNDANLGVVAEHLRGVARDVDDVAYLIARVGVGAGFLVDGVPLLGAHGLAGEIGHIVVQPGGPLCYCGNQGCFEQVVGERALFARAGLSGQTSAFGIGEVMKDADDGNVFAQTAIDDVCQWLAVGLASISHLVNPQLIVIGGSLSRLLDERQEDLQSSLDTLMARAPGEPARVCLGGLGEDATLLGAAELVFTDLLEAPLATASAHRGQTEVLGGLDAVPLRESRGRSRHARPAVRAGEGRAGRQSSPAG